jgi:hypothetical protein
MAEKNHQNAIQDNNQFPAITAHSGTAGTAETVRLTATSDGFLNVNSAAELTVGTIARVSTIGTLEVGTVTIGAVNSIGTILNLAAGSVRVTHGTITDGTLPLVTTVTNLTSGSVRMTVGTLTVMPNVPGGTLGLVSSVTEVANVATGTIAAVTSVTNIANLTKGTITRLEGGSVAVTIGTMVGVDADNTGTTVNPVLVAGRVNGTARTILLDASARIVNVMQVGTVNTGTIVANGGTAGKFNPAPSIVANAFGTTTAGTIGTLVAAPSAGSAIFITSLDISQVSGTAEVVVSYGLAAAGNQVINRGLYAAGGGIAKSYVPAMSGSATGTALTWNMLSGSGTVAYSIGYFIAVP